MIPGDPSVTVARTTGDGTSGRGIKCITQYPTPWMGRGCDPACATTSPTHRARSLPPGTCI